MSLFVLFKGQDFSELMKRHAFLFLIFLALTSFSDSEPAENGASYMATAVTNAPVNDIVPPAAISGEQFLRSLYREFPAGTFSWEAFKQAMIGRQQLSASVYLAKPDILTIVDFSKPSTQERLFVIDVKEAKILFKSLVAHGRNTGENMATRFSNLPESYQSSLGFYKTAETYTGSKGFSLRLDGLEKGINCEARARGIVMHAADYVSKAFAQQHGRLGRSQGCPALPKELNKPIINKIANGSLLFIYAPDTHYLKASRILRNADIEVLFAKSNDKVTG